MKRYETVCCKYCMPHNNSNLLFHQIRMFASKCVGSCVAIMTPAQVSDFVLNITSYSGVEAWTTTAGRLLSCGSALRAMGERGVEVKGDAMGVLHLGLNDDRVGVRNAACR